MDENVIGPEATRQRSSVPMISTEPSAYSRRSCAIAFCGPNERRNLEKRVAGPITLYMPLPSSRPTALLPTFRLSVRSRTSYRHVRLYSVQPGDKKSSPIFLPFTESSYSPRPQTTASARTNLRFTANSRRNRIEGRFVSVAPIHLACQSAGCSKPIVHSTGLLHAEAFPTTSHTRTFQKTGYKEYNDKPEKRNRMVSLEATFPLSH